jgi:hypothetical protein
MMILEVRSGGWEALMDVAANRNKAAFFAQKMDETTAIVAMTP